MEKQSVWRDKSIVGSPVVHLVGMAVVLFAFWMILAGRTEIKFIVYGILTSIVTAWITYPLLLVSSKDGSKKFFVFGISIFKMLRYSLWLLWQLVLANIDVAKATTSQNLDINPQIVRFYFRSENPMAAVVLADSITLTPGTVTINVTDDGLFEIHALTDGAASGVLDGSMQKQVAKLFGEKLDFAVAEGED